MDAGDDWLNGEDIGGLYWELMTERNRRAYRTREDDSARFHMRKEAFWTLCDLVIDGAVEITAKLVKSKGKKTNRIVYLGKQYFRNPNLFEIDNLSVLEFNGNRYEELRATLPENWKNIDDYFAKADKTIAYSEVRATENENLDNNPSKKGGRPSDRGMIFDAFRDIGNRVDLLHEKHPIIYDEVVRSIRGKRNRENVRVPVLRTVSKYIRAYREAQDIEIY